jgi:hypothetical protein
MLVADRSRGCMCLWPLRIRSISPRSRSLFCMMISGILCLAHKSHPSRDTHKHTFNGSVALRRREVNLTDQRDHRLNGDSIIVKAVPKSFG